MSSIAESRLVSVATAGPQVDGIEFDRPSASKVVVAVMDHHGRGPVFRTVAPGDVTERTESGPDDHALELLIRRTPAPTRGEARGAAGGVRGRPGHTRPASHRTADR